MLNTCIRIAIYNKSKLPIVTFPTSKKIPDNQLSQQHHKDKKRTTQNAIFIHKSTDSNKESTLFYLNINVTPSCCYNRYI